MTCAGALQLVEAIAAGDLAVDEDVRTHLETCPRCASALASARRIEAALRARPTPQPPPQFTRAVLGRIRNERWRSEERVDRVFNIAIVAAVLLVIGSVAAMTNVGAVLAGARTVWGVLSSVGGHALEVAAPTLATYIAAVGLLFSALAMWWWADRRLSL